MVSLSFNYKIDENSSFTTGDTAGTTTTESFGHVDNKSMGKAETVFSPLLAAQFQSRSSNELLTLLAQQEPRAADIAQFQGRSSDEMLTLLAQQEPQAADTAPSAPDVDSLMNFRLNGTESFFDDIDQNSTRNLFMGTSRAESVASHTNLWSEGSGAPAARNDEMMDTFDFLIKSLSSANNYVSMLTREQLSVLRLIRPSLLYEFLQEIAKVRGDKRMRRALPNECAFCKNNGENEDCYSSHALKDWRGRVLCPVLRAFRCPRCGATGDRAHTIKYCPENGDAGSLHTGLSSRRRMPPSSLLLGSLPGSSGLPVLRTPQPGFSPAAPASSPSTSRASPSHSSLWSNFGIN